MVTPKRKQSFGSKSGDRIQIINILAATSIALITVLVGLSSKNLNYWMLIQLSIATPCFITSSLAYSKLSYRDTKELEWWSSLGWVTFSIGYGLILNSMAILLYLNSHVLGYWFIGVAAFLFVVYSFLDIYLERERLKEKTLKLLFYFMLIVLGFLTPVFLNLI